jgi:hypothetical protein
MAFVSYESELSNSNLPTYLYFVWFQATEGVQMGVSLFCDVHRVATCKYFGIL